MKQKLLSISSAFAITALANCTQPPSKSPEDIARERNISIDYFSGYTSTIILEQQTHAFLALHNAGVEPEICQENDNALMRQSSDPVSDPVANSIKQSFALLLKSTDCATLLPSNVLHERVASLATLAADISLSRQSLTYAAHSIVNNDGGQDVNIETLCTAATAAKPSPTRAMAGFLGQIINLDCKPK